MYHCNPYEESSTGLKFTFELLIVSFQRNQGDPPPDTAYEILTITRELMAIFQYIIILNYFSFLTITRELEAVFQYIIILNYFSFLTITRELEPYFS